MAGKAAARRGRKNTGRPQEQPSIADALTGKVSGIQQTAIPDVPPAEARESMWPDVPAAEAQGTRIPDGSPGMVPETGTPLVPPAGSPATGIADDSLHTVPEGGVPAAPPAGSPDADIPDMVPEAVPGASSSHGRSQPFRARRDRTKLRKPAYLLAHERAESARDEQRSADAAAWLRQAEEEERERAAIEERRRMVEEEQNRLRAEEEQRRLREQVDREVEERTAAEERRLWKEQEARIEEEVERRLREAEEDTVPQIIFSPKMERAKRATVFWIVSGIVVLALVSILLGIRNDRLRRELAGQREQEQQVAEEIIPEENADAEMTGETGSGTEAPVTESTRSVYLTFDDGPSPVTEQVLDILKQYDVKATFFVVGRVDEASKETYRRIVEEGHTLALHSYTHDYALIYESLDSFQTDLHKLQNLLYEETGVWCKVFRFPGGSSNAASRVDMQELVDYLEREDITYYDWNVYGGDDISPDLMRSNVMANVEKYDNAVILLHDAADKEETVEALPGIIEYIQGLDRTVLLPITDDTVPVQHGGKP